MGERWRDWRLVLEGRAKQRVNGKTVKFVSKYILFGEGTVKMLLPSTVAARALIKQTPPSEPPPGA